MNGRPRPGKCQKTKNERTNKSCMSLTAAGVLFVGGHCVIFPVFSAGTGNPSLFLLLSLPKAHIPSQEQLTPNTLNLPALKGGGGRMTGRRGRGGGSDSASPIFCLVCTQRSRCSDRNLNNDGRWGFRALFFS